MRLLLPLLAACTSAATEPAGAPAPVLAPEPQGASQFAPADPPKLALPAEEDAPAPVPQVAEAPRGLPPDGCPASIDELPVQDERLRGDSVIVVLKGARRVLLFDDGAAKGCWRVGLGTPAPGPKRMRGDRKTPEGWYRTSDRPWSQYYHAITIHYPNREDADRGLADGLIDEPTHAAILAALESGKIPPTNTRLGSDLLLHGGGSEWDWTLGCVALEDDDIDALRAQLPKGMATDVLILP